MLPPREYRSDSFQPSKALVLCPSNCQSIFPVVVAVSYCPRSWSSSDAKLMLAAHLSAWSHVSTPSRLREHTTLNRMIRGQSLRVHYLTCSHDVEITNTTENSFHKDIINSDVQPQSHYLHGIFATLKSCILTTIIYRTSYLHLWLAVITRIVCKSVCIDKRQNVSVW